MKNTRVIFSIVLVLGFMGLGVVSFIQSKPSVKSDRVYLFVKQFSPYYLEKRFGGITIKSKEDEEFKSKPSNTELFHALETLERDWGIKHLRFSNGNLIVVDTNATLSSLTQDEIAFITSYYGVKW